MPIGVLALRIAEAEVGVKEQPAGTNDGPRVKQYQAVTGAYRAAWCASFAQWCLKKAGMPQPFLERSAYVPYIAAVGKKSGWAVTVPAPGDLVCYDWEKDGVPDHIGIVREVVDHRTFTAVEGNTAVGDNSNGGEVMVRQRSVSDVFCFLRVPDPPDTRPLWVQKLDSPTIAPMWAWIAWKDHGAPAAYRPAKVPTKVPKAWWARYALHVRKPK